MRGEPSIKVLVAEDEPSLGDLLGDFLAGRGHRVTVTRDGRSALDALRAQPFDVALLDIAMPELDGLEVLRQVRDDPLPTECIIITGNSTIDTAIAAMRLGAYDYVGKPYRMVEIDALVRRAWEKRRLATDNRRLASHLSRVEGARDLSSAYAPMQAVLALARRVAPSDARVLVTGEPGAGKSEFARYLHRHSGRDDAPLVEASCGTMPDGRATAELFGVGASHDGDGASRGPAAAGLFELASGGTLVLENVVELEPAAQAGLADALSHGAFRRLGARARIDVDARLVTTSRVDPATAVRGGAFRPDLLQQLAQVTVVLPPLRERAMDIPPLAQAFVREFGGLRAPTLAVEAVEALQAYSWPGNLRELRNVLERAVLLSGGGIIHAHDLPLPDAARGGSPDDVPLSLAEIERRHIVAVLQRTNWHQGRAAHLLGISAKTLYRKIREYGLERPGATASP